MSVKKRMQLAFISAMIFSLGAFTMLYFVYSTFFKTWTTLCFLLTVILSIGGWAWFYIERLRYKESIAPKKHKFYGKGNRKNRRKGL